MWLTNDYENELELQKSPLEMFIFQKAHASICQVASKKFWLFGNPGDIFYPSLLDFCQQLNMLL